jgi:hypothetical protein
VAIDEMHVISGMIEHIMSSAVNSLNSFMDEIRGVNQRWKNEVWVRWCDRLQECAVDMTGISFRVFVAEQPMRAAAGLAERMKGRKGKASLKAYEWEDLNTVSMFGEKC